jgi:hypothetical protein
MTFNHFRRDSRRIFARPEVAPPYGLSRSASSANAKSRIPDGFLPNMGFHKSSDLPLLLKYHYRPQKSAPMRTDCQFIRLCSLTTKRTSKYTLTAGRQTA